MSAKRQPGRARLPVVPHQTHQRDPASAAADQRIKPPPPPCHPEQSEGPHFCRNDLSSVKAFSRCCGHYRENALTLHRTNKRKRGPALRLTVEITSAPLMHHHNQGCPSFRDFRKLGTTDVDATPAGIGRTRNREGH